MKKKTYISILSMISIAVLFVVVRAMYADRTETQPEVAVHTASIVMDGAPLDIETMVYGDMVYVPLEGAAKQFGGGLQIDEEKKLINISGESGQEANTPAKGKTLAEGKQSQKIEKSNYNIQFNHIDTYLEPVRYKDDVYVPLQYLSEYFNKEIVWDKEKNTVSVSDLHTDVIGNVDGLNITMREFNKYFNKAYENLKNGGSDNLEKETAELKKQLFDNLVTIKILDKKVAENKIELENADYDNINKSLKEIVDSYEGISNFREKLVKYEVYFSEVVADQRSNMIYGKLWNKYTNHISVDEQTVKKFYEDNKATMFTKPESVKVKQIVLNTTDKTGKQFSAEEKGTSQEKGGTVAEKDKRRRGFRPGYENLHRGAWLNVIPGRV